LSDRKREILWRTLVFSRTLDGKDAPENWLSQFLVILNGPSYVPSDFALLHPELSGADLTQAFIQPFLEAVRRQILGRRWIFETEGGHLGLASHTASVGDYVCVILGCNLPMILRERMAIDNRSIPATTHGPAYLYDYMHGKAIEEVETSVLSLETFELL